MLDIMYEVPTKGAPVREVVINEETIQKGPAAALHVPEGAGGSGWGIGVLTFRNTRFACTPEGAF